MSHATAVAVLDVLDRNRRDRSVHRQVPTWVIDVAGRFSKARAVEVTATESLTLLGAPVTGEVKQR